MNDYMNHKWRKFLDETPQNRPVQRKLYEGKGNRSIEQTQGGAKTITIPELRITDSFGVPNSESRRNVHMFFSKLGRLKGGAGAASAMTQKIDQINEFLNTPADKASLQALGNQRILGSLVVLDIFSTIVHEFDPSSAGYLFEPFLAALYGGKGKQVKTKTGGIEDIWDMKGEYVSLKLLGGGEEESKRKPGEKKKYPGVGGSLQDLRWSLRRKKQPLRYILALKKGTAKNISSIEFYEFTIGTDGREWHWETASDQKSDDPDREETIQWIPYESRVLGDITIDKTITPKSPPPGIGARSITTGRDYEYRLPTEDRGRKGVHASWGGDKAPQFSVKLSEISEFHIGTIKFGGAKFLKGLSEKYVVGLQSGIAEIYNDLDEMSKSVNLFLMKNAAGSGDRAVAASERLVNNVNCVTKKQQCPPGK